jgi:aerobic carbon-monoxide dehydrogenase medium subunit
MHTTCPSAFDYHRPASLGEALELLGSLEDARPLAGGHSLLPIMKTRLASPAALVDIGRLADLAGVTLDGDTLTIGALTTHADVAASETVRSACPILAETAAHIGDRQVRHRGTIGGSLAHADPGADYPTVVKALGATIVGSSTRGERSIPADDFFTGIFATALEPDELVTAVRIPGFVQGTAGAYLRHRNPASGYTVVGVAAVGRLEAGACSALRVTVGGVTGFPVDARAAAEALVGQGPSEAAIADAAGRVGEALLQPIGDSYASGEYRVHLAGVLAKRALRQALAA